MIWLKVIVSIAVLVVGYFVGPFPLGAWGLAVGFYWGNYLQEQSKEFKTRRKRAEFLFRVQDEFDAKGADINFCPTSETFDYVWVRVGDRIGVYAIADVVDKFKKALN